MPPRIGRSPNCKPPERYRAACGCTRVSIETTSSNKSIGGFKQRIQPMIRFKRFETVAVTIRSVELAEKIDKHQFNPRPLTGKATTATWEGKSGNFRLRKTTERPRVDRPASTTNNSLCAWRAIASALSKGSPQQKAPTQSRS
jgi:hypothetical protein